MGGKPGGGAAGEPPLPLPAREPDKVTFTSTPIQATLSRVPSECRLETAVTQKNYREAL